MSKTAWDQSFIVTLRVNADLKSGADEKPYLTENRVRQQVRKFLLHHSIADGLPCHGDSEIVVSEVLEDNKEILKPHKKEKS